MYPIALLGNQILIINEGDIPFVGKERALEVMCVQVDFRHTTIYPIIEMEKHMRFNPWKEIDGKERELFLQKLQSTFSEEEISEKIKKPLAENAIKDDAK